MSYALPITSTPRIYGVSDAGDLQLDRVGGRWYGSAASPITGNLTVDLTGAKTSGVAVVFHYGTSAPIITTTEVVESITGEYQTGSNLIYVTRTPSGVIINYAPALGVPANSVTPAITSYTEKSGTYAGLDVPFANETMTSSDGTWSSDPTLAYQWFVDDVAVSGETSTTYTPTVNDAGLEIFCRVTATNTFGSATADTVAIACWHPKDVVGVKIVHLGNRGVESATGVPSTDGANAAIWLDGSGLGNDADTSPGKEPVFSESEIHGSSAVAFDGVDQYMRHSGADALDVFRDVGYGYLFAVSEDTDPTGGDDYHIIAGWNGASATRLQIATKQITAGFQVGARRLDSDGFVSTVSAHAAGWHVITGEAAWSDGDLNLRVDGTQTATTTFTTSGNTPDTASSGSRVGSNTGTSFFNPMNLAGLVVASADTAMTSKSIARIERHLGLLANLDIALDE